MIDHPGGSFYAWRNDNYWGDNWGAQTIRFYSVNQVEAAFVYVPIHGQILNAFIPGQPVVAPDWFSESPSYRGNLLAGQLSDEINARREAVPGLGQVSVSRVNGNWSDLTVPGVQLILASRIAFLTDHFALGWTLELLGKPLTNGASRTAVRRITDAVAQEIAAARNGTNIPVFIDIVGHSRGGAVGSAVANELRSRAARSGMTVAVSMTHLDAIDPSGPNPARPLARAGYLLDDPIIENRSIDRVSNYHAENTFFDWGGGVGTWSWFVRHLANHTLADLGIPIGRPRSTAGQGTNFLVAGTDHVSIAEVVPGVYAAAIGRTAPAFSLQRSTFLGTLWTDPTVPINQLLQNRCCDGYMPRAARPADFVVDNNFALTRRVISQTREALADSTFASELTDEIWHVREFLTRLAQSDFPPDGPWTRSDAGVAIAPTDGITLNGGAAIRQELDSASLDSRMLICSVRYQFDDASGHLTMRLTGPSLQSQTTITNSGPTGHVLEHSFLAFRASPTGIESDIFEASGNGVRLLQVHISTCIADVDDGSGTGRPDGGVTIEDLSYYLDQYSHGSTRADFDDGSGTGTLDGGVTIDDLLYYLVRFEAGC